MRIIYIYSLFLVSLFILGSCDKKNKAPLVGTEMSETFISEVNPEDTIISYIRTPCFGTCPHFEFLIRNDFSCTYEGKNFVENKGNYKGTVGKDQIELIYSIKESIQYDDLKEVYDNKMVSDLPSIYTGIFTEGELKMVHNRYQGPKKLKDLYVVLDEIIESIEWIKIEDND